MTESADSLPDEAAPSAAERRLIDAGVRYVLAAPVEGAQSLEEFAERSGIRPRQVLKSLLLDVAGSGYAMLLASGDRSADFAALRRHFGVRSVRLADRDVVQAITGYRIGTVTPLGAKTADLPILIDETALGEEFVSLGTGRSGRHVRLDPADLMRALGAVAGPFARPAGQDV